ncbi:PPP4R4_2 [Blepharisma stoltei]|uniref:Serine/threonine protein phosphatase 2A regulatory subunit n=1 Tax=Blepharisma stoltei TaxID=1481888 RepID=A0AAU9JK51_9CILI|nr:unnamed protein product [Blepharisma stoltei]
MVSALQNGKSYFNETQFEIEGISGTKKTEAEIQLWSTTEGISEFEKGMIFLQSGFPQQKLWALQNLDKIFRENFEGMFNFVKNRFNAEDWDLELKIAFGQGVINAVKQEIFPQGLCEEILEVCISILRSLATSLHETWIQVFACVISSGISNTQIEKAISFTIDLSDFNQKPVFRHVSCKLLKIIAQKIKFGFKGQLFQRAKALSQDTDSEVRQEMCITWIEICNYKSQNEIQEKIFYEILKLVDDEVISVKVEAVVCLIKVIPFLSKDFISRHAIPVIKKELLVETHIEIQHIFSELIGELLISIKPLISPDIRESFLKSLLFLKDSDFIVRKNIAYNFPAIFSILGTCQIMKDILTRFVNDAESEIKIAIAKGLHEISKLDISCKTIAFLATQLLEDQESQFFIIKNAQWWASRISSISILGKITNSIQTGNWREQIKFLEILNENIVNFHINDLLENIVPILLQKMQNDNFSLKLLSARVLSRILYHTHYTSRKLEIINSIKDKFARSSSCYDRILFIDFIEFSMSYQSKEYFSKNFFDEILNISHDLIDSVRLKIAMILPIIREVIPDRQIYQVENLTEFLIEDSSANVRNTAINSKEIMKSDEYNKKIYSDEEQRDFQQRCKFEEEQAKLDSKEIEDNKRRMVVEFASKAREALRQKRNEKAKTQISHLKTRSASGQPILVKPQRNTQPSIPLRAGSSSRRKNPY